MLKNINYKNITIHNNMIYKNNPYISIDLNSIAKGYAVDQISLLLNKKGYVNHLVEIGGELKSSNNNMENWFVGIQDPLSDNIIRKIKLNNYSMATSGTYNNYFEIDNKKYSHIISPTNGYPYEYSLISATVISENCIDADAFATLAFTMDVDSFLNVVNSHEGVECFLITIDDNEIVSFYESENFNDFIY